MEDLIVLNDEMAALVRAGVPLEQGLRQLYQKLGHRDDGKLMNDTAF